MVQVTPSSPGALQGGPAGALEMLEIQRSRLLIAMRSVVGECGLAGTSITQVVGRAGVSRRTFYELFEGREECFLTVVKDTLACIEERVVPAYLRAEDWRTGIRAGLTVFLSMIENDPAIGRIAVVETLAAGSEVLQYRARTLARIAEIVDRGRLQPKPAGDRPAPPLTAEAQLGAVLSLVHAHLVEHADRSLLELIGPMMSALVLPYLGPIEAERELAQRPPSAKSRRDHRGGKPEDTALAALPIRLTYRTVRVLQAIAAHPGASNRQVGALAGTTDQGQISRLLRRLQGLELVVNANTSPNHGAPNQWKLTETGRNVQRTLTAHGPSAS